MKAWAPIIAIFLLFILISTCQGVDESAPTWTQKADKSLSSREYNLAIKLYDKALELDSNNTYVWSQKGSSYKKLGDNLFFSEPWEATTSYEKALQSYDNAIEIDPLNATNWYSKAELQFLLSRYADALECYNNAIFINPNYFGAIYGRYNTTNHLERIDRLWYASKFIAVAVALILLLIFLIYFLWILKFSISDQKKMRFESYFSRQSPQIISNQIENAIGSFQATRNRPLRLSFFIFPWLSLLLSANSWIYYKNPMEASAFLAVSLSIFAFLHLTCLIPRTLNDLWRNGLIALNRLPRHENNQELGTIESTTTLMHYQEGDSFGQVRDQIKTQGLSLHVSKENTTYKKNEIESMEEGSVLSREAIVAARYLCFIKDFEKILNSPCQWISAMVFVIIGVWIYFYSFGDIILDPKTMFYIISNMSLDPILLMNALIGFIIGCIAWRMIAIGIQVFSIGWKLDIEPNLLHQDGCGGLSSLGYLCFWNVLITSILGVFLAGWIILVRIPPFSIMYGDFYIPIHMTLLILVVEWLAFGFFLPMWSIHKELMVNKDIFIRDRGKLGAAIEDLRQEMLRRSYDLSAEEYLDMSNKLKRMIETYSSSPIYPTWPFNSDILKKLAISQVIPVITLLGVGDQISGVVKILADALSQINL
ncbi:MAG: tetratricopeptide repeat protein [Methanothrix sp.]